MSIVKMAINPSFSCFYRSYSACCMLMLLCGSSLPSDAAVVGALFEDKGKLCFDVPSVRKKTCEKLITVEEALPCPGRLVEKEQCRYEDVEQKLTCPKVKKMVKGHKCIKNKKVKECWNEPQQKSKICKQTIIRQEPYSCARSVSFEKCIVEEYKVNQMCHKTVMKPTSYMCYRNKPLCSKEHCNKTVDRDEPYPCHRTVHRALCTDNNRKYRQGASYCPTVAVQEEGTCYKPKAVQEVDELCMKQPCKMQMQYSPHTCQTRLPSLEAYQCSATRKRERCTDHKKEEMSTCYRDIEDEVKYDCMEVEWKERCEEFVVRQVSTCQRTLEETQHLPCKEKRKQRVCEVRMREEQRTCYTTKQVVRIMQCYETEFHKQCLA
eukprot:GHVS01097875.1.p1 GENE.GHVS01097875.1~~GHVS01097875.1.p1  ORF type:complete len:378 (-),score=51.97 GHVS01097875.1:356-1489(-)